LRQIGIEPSVIADPAVAEFPLGDETPEKYADRLALAKAAAIASAWPQAFVLAADTIVAVGRRICGKAETAADAARFLNLLSGRRHRVISSVAVIAPEGRAPGLARAHGLKRVVSRVRFKRLHEAEISAYVAGNEWRGKAGGYAIQGQAGAFVMALEGSYSGVVGLPLYETLALLQGLGFRPGHDHKVS
jgi:septum formation protein